MAGKAIIIHVANAQVTVAQYLSICGGVVIDPAQNWRELEQEAIAAITALGGSVQLSGCYSCPARLAERAIFFEGSACAVINRHRVLF